MQLGISIRNARLNAIAAALPNGSILQILAGPKTFNCALPDASPVLASFTLATGWLSAAGNGQIDLSSTLDSTVTATGVAGHFRIYDPTLTTCYIQGSITATGKGGDIVLANTTLTLSNDVKVTEFSLIDGNL